MSFIQKKNCCRKSTAKPVAASTNETASSDDRYIVIKLVDHSGYEAKLKVKRTLPMSKIRCTYAERKNVPMDTFKFYYDGRRVQCRDTAESLEMEEGDVIDVYVDQIGGGFDFILF